MLILVALCSGAAAARHPVRAPVSARHPAAAAAAAWQRNSWRQPSRQRRQCEQPGSRARHSRQPGRQQAQRGLTAGRAQVWLFIARLRSCEHVASMPVAGTATSIKFVAHLLHRTCRSRFSLKGMRARTGRSFTTFNSFSNGSRHGSHGSLASSAHNSFTSVRSGDCLLMVTLLRQQADIVAAGMAAEAIGEMPQAVGCMKGQTSYPDHVLWASCQLGQEQRSWQYRLRACADLFSPQARSPQARAEMLAVLTQIMCWTSCYSRQERRSRQREARAAQCQRAAAATAGQAPHSHHSRCCADAELCQLLVSVRHDHV